MGWWKVIYKLYFIFLESMDFLTDDEEENIDPSKEYPNIFILTYYLNYCN